MLAIKDCGTIFKDKVAVICCRSDGSIRKALGHWWNGCDFKFKSQHWQVAEHGSMKRPLNLSSSVVSCLICKSLWTYSLLNHNMLNLQQKNIQTYWTSTRSHSIGSQPDCCLYLAICQQAILKLMVDDGSRFNTLEGHTLSWEDTFPCNIRLWLASIMDLSLARLSSYCNFSLSYR